MSFSFNLPLDSYAIEARRLPTAIVWAPLVVTAICAAGGLGIDLKSLIGAGLLVALLYLGSVPIRHSGRTIESALSNAWGGLPTFRYLRWTDTTLHPTTKAQLHDAVKRLFGIALSTPDEEAKDSEEANRRIVQAMPNIREWVRRRDPGGLWSKHLAEYGFARNLLGARRFWLMTSLISGSIAVAVLALTGKQAMLAAAVYSGLNLGGAVWLGEYVLPDFTESVANRYAESLLASFLATSKEE